MFIASHNKNPLINFERKGLKQQKSQKSLGSKFPKYAWNLKINEKGRVIWSYRPWERKTLQKDQRKTTKNWLDALTDRIEREKVLKSLKSVWSCEKERFLKNSLYNFRLIENKVRSIENASTDPTSIEHRSKQTEVDQNFNRNFDRSRNNFDQSKF